MIIVGDSILQDSYPVIVIGSGLAGLTSAALLAKRGLKVLLIEHHYLPGGMCTTLRRKDFSFDTGTALLYGFGKNGVNPHTFVMNEIEEATDIIAHDMLLRINFGDKKINFWPDYEKFLVEITQAFPDQADQLRALYGYLYEVYTKVIARQQMVVPPTEMPMKDNLIALLKHPMIMIQTLKMLNTSTESILKKYITDPDLLDFFDKLTSTYCYCTTRETPAILSATMFVDNHIGGAYYPARSPQILSSTLEKALEKYGGETLYGQRVEEIIIENGTATGVRLLDGSVIRAKYIVANATVWNLYGKLIKPEHIKPERLIWAKNLVPTYPAMVLYLGVKAEAIPAGTNPVEMFIADKEGVNSGDVTVYISSLDDPSIAPPGTHAMTVIAPSTIPWADPADDNYSISQDYLQQKRKERDRIIDQLEQHFPNLKQNILVIETGTPSTIERYTLKNKGAVGGPKQAIGQELMKRLHARSEWKNLYFCGDSTVMGMGTPAVTVSGVGAANMVLRDAGLQEYKRRTFTKDYVSIVKGKALQSLPEPQKALTPDTAIRLARECLYCESPGCTQACPAHIDIRNVMRKIEAGNFIGAARTLHEMNPLSEICGYTCRPNPVCEASCNRLSFSDKSVRIAELQSWVCLQADKNGWINQEIKTNGNTVSIVGAGPAGISSAHWLARLGYKVTLFDRLASPGGSLLYIPHEEIPQETIVREIAALMLPNISFKGGQVLTSEGVDEILNTDTEKTVVLLTTGQGPIPYTQPQKKVFTAGSLVQGPCSVVKAVGDAKRVVKEIHQYFLDEKH
jgi:C-3',4' desaturase CrtD